MRVARAWVWWGSALIVAITIVTLARLRRSGGEPVGRPELSHAPPPAASGKPGKTHGGNPPPARAGETGENPPWCITGNGYVMEYVPNGSRTYTHLPRGRYRLQARVGESV